MKYIIIGVCTGRLGASPAENLGAALAKLALSKGSSWAPEIVRMPVVKSDPRPAMTVADQADLASLITGDKQLTT